MNGDRVIRWAEKHGIDDLDEALDLMTEEMALQADQAWDQKKEK